jgi:hypothetical protein
MKDMYVVKDGMYIYKGPKNQRALFGIAYSIDQIRQSIELHHGAVEYTLTETEA